MAVEVGKSWARVFLRYHKLAFATDNSFNNPKSSWKIPKAFCWASAWTRARRTSVLVNPCYTLLVNRSWRKGKNQPSLITFGLDVGRQSRLTLFNFRFLSRMIARTATGFIKAQKKTKNCTSMNKILNFLIAPTETWSGPPGWKHYCNQNFTPPWLGTDHFLAPLNESKAECCGCVRFLCCFVFRNQTEMKS